MNSCMALATPSQLSSSDRPLQVYCISENCGNDCHPDMLAEHNSGKLLADVSFVHTRRGEAALTACHGLRCQ